MVTNPSWDLRFSMSVKWPLWWIYSPCDPDHELITVERFYLIMPGHGPSAKRPLKLHTLCQGQCFNVIFAEIHPFDPGNAHTRNGLSHLFLEILYCLRCAILKLCTSVGKCNVWGPYLGCNRPMVWWYQAPVDPVTMRRASRELPNAHTSRNMMKTHPTLSLTIKLMLGNMDAQYCHEHHFPENCQPTSVYTVPRQ